MAQGASAVDKYLGTWYVSYSTLKMWKKGDKTNPVLVLSGKSDKGGVVSWDSDLTYDQRGWLTSNTTPGTAAGKEIFTGADPLSFRWTGKGLLRPFSLKSKVVAHDPDFAEYAVVHFSATLVTEEGIDIFTRGEQLTPERVKEIMASTEPSIQQLAERDGLIYTRTAPAAP